VLPDSRGSGAKTGCNERAFSAGGASIPVDTKVVDASPSAVGAIVGLRLIAARSPQSLRGELFLGSCAINLIKRGRSARSRTFRVAWGEAGGGR
jgi:hypothetical protein